MTTETLLIDVQTLLKGAKVLRALNNPTRQNIIKLIHGSRRINVTDIYTKLKIEQAVASQQLAILRQEHFVNTERNGKVIYYSLNYERFAQVGKLIKDVLR
jgi:DNA-binding transcriptional ArsR family regulator